MQIIKIKNIQYGPSKTDDDNPDVFTSTTTYPSNPTSQRTQLYANFEIVDHGEGFYKDDGLGNSVPIYKTFSTLGVTLTENTSLAIQIEFASIISGYCNDGTPGSIYGIKSIDTSMQKDRVKLPFKFTGGTIQNAIQLLQNKTFRITSTMMGISDRAFSGVGGGAFPSVGTEAKKWPTVNQVSAFRSGQAPLKIGGMAKGPVPVPKLGGPTPPPPPPPPPPHTVPSSVVPPMAPGKHMAHPLRIGNFPLPVKWMISDG